MLRCACTPSWLSVVARCSCAQVDHRFFGGSEYYSASTGMLPSLLEAQLTPSLSSSGRCCVHVVDDMLPHVFQGLLHFVYTNSLPEMAPWPEERTMAERLLAAADRLFHMHEPKLVCAEVLSSDMSVDTVTKKLRQHSCHMLRDACIEFLGDPPVSCAPGGCHGNP